MSDRYAAAVHSAHRDLAAALRADLAAALLSLFPVAESATTVRGAIVTAEPHNGRAVRVRADGLPVFDLTADDARALAVVLMQAADRAPWSPR